MIALYAFGALYALWILFGFVMGLKRIRDSRQRVIAVWRFRFDVGGLPVTAYLLGFPVLLIGWLLDILCNMILLTVYLWELPRARELTVTARLKRHYKLGSGRGYTLAVFLETALVLGGLDPSGKHIFS